MTSQPEIVTLRAEPSDEGRRLDVFLASRLEGESRSSAQQLIASGGVLLNGRPARPSARLGPGDTVSVALAGLGAPGPSPLVPEDVPLDVVYEDEDVVVLDKPAGMVVHPSPGHERGTLVHALLARYPELGAEGGERPGIVHRLDRDTSGLMLVARHARAHRYLQDLLRERRVLKEYTLLCCGELSPPAATIEAPISRHPRDRLRMAVVSTGRPAVTEYRTLRALAGHTLASARPITGRTHQIRVHFASIVHPIAGDSLYGGCSAPGLRRQFLHSSRLELTLPSGRTCKWHSPLPPDLEATLAALGA